MKTVESGIPIGMERFNGLLAWWGMPTDSDEINARTKRFEGLVVELSNLFKETSSTQAQALMKANEKFAHCLQKLLSARQAPELMSAQSIFMAEFMECLAAQTQIWAELTQKVQGCCADMAREAAKKVAEQAAEPTFRPAGKDGGKRTVHS